MVGSRNCPAAFLLLIALLGAVVAYALPRRDATGVSVERYEGGGNAQRLSPDKWITATRAQRALQGIDLFAARGYGKREDCTGRLCSRRMGLTGARLYGKRNVNTNQFKCFFMDCRHLNGGLEDISFYPNSIERRTAAAVLMPDD